MVGWMGVFLEQSLELTAVKCYELPHLLTIQLTSFLSKCKNFNEVSTRVISEPVLNSLPTWWMITPFRFAGEVHAWIY